MDVLLQWSKKFNSKCSSYENCTVSLMTVVFCNCFPRLSYRASFALVWFVCLVTCAANTKKELQHMVKMASGVIERD